METLRQVENARETLSHTSPESLDLGTLTVDVLRILCEERGISVGQSKGLRKGDLIELLKVRKRSHLARRTHVGD